MALFAREPTLAYPPSFFSFIPLLVSQVNLEQMEQFLQAGCQPKEHKVVSTDHNQSPALILTSPTVTILTEKLTFDGQ